MRNSLRATLLFSFLTGLYACAKIEPSSLDGQPIVHTYTDPIDSGLSAHQPYPNPEDVCVSLNSNKLIQPYEIENHILIACPKHETGAIADRKSQQKATVIGNARHWVLMRVRIQQKSQRDQQSV